MEHRENERLIEIDGEQWLAVPVTARLKAVDTTQFSQTLAKAAGAKSSMFWKEVNNPDLVWAQFILDTEGANKNWDYLPRPSLVDNFATAKHKPMDMEHVIVEDTSLLHTAKTPRGKNTIFGVMTDSALADSEGNLLTQKQLSKLDKSDDMTRKANEKLTVVGWAAMWNMIFPKTVADVAKYADAGQLCVSMERWISKWDFLVLHGKEYKSITRDEAKVLNYDQAWAKRQMVNHAPILRRSLKFLYGGVASTLNPANPACIFIEPEITAKAKASISDDVTKKLLESRERIKAAYVVSICETERQVLRDENLRVTRALAAYVGWSSSGKDGHTNDTGTGFDLTEGTSGTC